eukprot:1327978-Amorphochlora_amoeboformis.AAC.2
MSRRNKPAYQPQRVTMLSPDTVYKGVVVKVMTRAAIVDIGFATKGVLNRRYILPPKITKFINYFDTPPSIEERAEHPKCEDAREVVAVGNVIRVVVTEYKQKQVRLARAPMEQHKKKHVPTVSVLSTSTTRQNSASTTPVSSQAPSPARRRRGPVTSLRFAQAQQYESQALVMRSCGGICEVLSIVSADSTSN